MRIDAAVAYGRCYSRMDTVAHQSLLEELDARQDELLQQLDDLAAKIDRVLNDCQSLRGITAEAA